MSVEPGLQPGGQPTGRGRDDVAGWRPRVVVSDLDGTFLSPDGSVSEVNRAAVVDALAAGIEVLFATGRPPRWLQVVAALGLSSTVVIASNGALVYDLAQQRVLASRPIQPGVIEAVVSDLTAALPDVAFAVEHGWEFRCSESYLARESADTVLHRVAARELAAGPPAYKLLVQHQRLSPDELAETVEPLVGRRLTVTHSATDRIGLLECSAAGVSKASTLAGWCAERGISSADVAGFGDMPNDRAMLEWVGRPHVMARAHPSLADLGATVIGSNADSAVGGTVRGWL